MLRFVRIIAELTKAKITLFVAITGAAGYILCRRGVDFGMVFPCIGLFLLACGSAALNHYQERDTDAQMARTRLRPIPSGEISPIGTLQVVVVFVTLGLVCLAYRGGASALLLGVLALFWYNGVYFYLKRKTAFAVVPGSLVGALGPMIGWAAAGGGVLHLHIVIVALFFFVWQIPHFWLLLLKYGKEYEAAGYPSLTQRLSLEQIKRMTFVWMVAMVSVSLLMPLSGVARYAPTAWALAMVGIIVIVRAGRLLRPDKTEFPVRMAFVDINIYALAVTIIICADALVS